MDVFICIEIKADLSFQNKVLLFSMRGAIRVVIGHVWNDELLWGVIDVGHQVNRLWWWGNFGFFGNVYLF